MFFGKVFVHLLHLALPHRWKCSAIIAYEAKGKHINIIELFEVSN